MKILGVLLLTLLLGACRTMEMATPSTLIIEPTLRNNLGYLAEGLDKEMAVCLYGPTWGDTATATTLVIPRITSSQRGSVAYEDCPGRPVAFWHNHPSPLEVFPTGDPHCWLSDTDLRTSLREKRPFEIVQTSRTNYCWFNRGQILEFTSDSIPSYMHAIPGQGVAPTPTTRAP